MLKWFYEIDCGKGGAEFLRTGFEDGTGKGKVVSPFMRGDPGLPEGPDNRESNRGTADHMADRSGGLISPATLVDLFRPLEHARKVLLAVSGGPDSVALMLLAAQWAEAVWKAPPLSVASVDHGLRPDSLAEAEQVAEWAARLGLPHHILRWEGEKPKTRLQERARDARYGLLIAHAETIGADYLVTAHHADDQAETILFRLLRGSGPRGLKGMESLFQRGELLHARPLLGMTKAELLAICDTCRHPFFTDPSNLDVRFARARLRRMERRFASAGLDRAALLRLGQRAARAEAVIAERAAALRASLPAERAPGFVQLDLALVSREPEEILLRLIEAEILDLTARERPPRLERLEALCTLLRAALLQGKVFKSTLGGVRLHLDAGGKLKLCPEKPRGKLARG
ncbi:tRNA lysidine(34) synthetase TilS [Beijerinckia indica]|uniref:tRNA(Ile)-lysidine synthase n=1 Tax=Beijerinckia indica subsp. indica (strain ATCC 9039 / DSM 1715 / NCIMB 8712) TaxID=395963 RepID=B2IGB5_BEII9|nr:tRNA lysidine(34) synthetase TilS [Beijerinckia indica]ACB97189.1 tRNA(Ile)-lysidine synthetase [Beijerinckia indica subsp. indica ATCC 9039]